MRNVTLPTPVFLAGLALCLLAGYLVGTVVGPDTPERTTATVATFDSATSQLCLVGDAVKGQDGADSHGRLCGVWRRTRNTPAPHKGEKFRFVAVRTTGTSEGKPEAQTVIYGNVVE